MRTAKRGSGGRRDAWVRVAVTVAMVGGATAFLVFAPRYRWEWHRIWPYRDTLLAGLWTTLQVSFLAMLLALALGVAGGVARLSRSAAWSQAAIVYVETIRGTPLLVQVFVARYGVFPALGEALARADAPSALRQVVHEPILQGVLTLGVFAGAYVTEIVRAAIESVDRGQTEAALSQGMTQRQVLRWVLFPQALRRMLPPLAGEMASLVKDSSLLAYLLVPELFKRASEVSSTTYRTFEVFLPVALLYLCINLPLSRLSRWMERRLDPGAAARPAPVAA